MLVHDTRSFVVRVQFNPAPKRKRVNGVVEVVETGQRHPFGSAAELWAIVASGGGRGRPSGRPRTRGDGKGGKKETGD